jgi:hypothetical protein
MYLHLSTYAYQVILLAKNLLDMCGDALGLQHQEEK